MLEFVAVLVIWNIAVLILYGIDKVRAARGKWRISENTLLVCSFLAGGLGAFLGMNIFRHKTKSIKFRMFVPIALVLNIVAGGFIYGNIGEPAEEAAVYIRITPSEAREIMQSGNVIVLDVRTEGEFNEGHIEGAILLPGTEIEARAAEVIVNKNQTILVYCRSGTRSAAAAWVLIEIGYTSVYDFGGILDWPYEIVR